MAEKIGDVFLRMGAMTQEEVDDVLQRQQDGDTRLFGQIALALEYIDHNAIAAYLVETTKED
jgi:hypothetical protein